MEPDGGKGQWEVTDIDPDLGPHGEHDEHGGKAEEGEHVAHHGRGAGVGLPEHVTDLWLGGEGSGL